jgi:hypothetical protein
MSNIKHLRSADSEAAPPFAIAMAEWANAKAAVAGLEATPYRLREDNRAHAALDALRATEWKLLQTPAETLLEIRERGHVVLEMFCVADRDGRPTDNRHRLMLAALVSEILRYTPE